MTPTKEQQAQEYAKQIQKDFIHNRLVTEELAFKDIEAAWLDGYTAAEQSMWRSVEEELSSNDNNVLVYAPSTEFRIGGYEVAYYDGEDWYTSDGEHIRPSHFMYIPSLPETNTEKK